MALREEKLEHGKGRWGRGDCSVRQGSQGRAHWEGILAESLEVRVL